ncbi:MAG: pyridoxamine kinase [Oscillospiraceae bacterium]|nr:pyridoxamine kinase [Oscillospiraceae bacterium]
MSQQRVLAVHDISCFGRCSLTVALPIISAAGFECTVLPTAVLSTHTGGFTGYTFRDLTSDVLPIAQHWDTLGLEFDAIYTGYLGSIEQIELVLQLIDFQTKRGNSPLVFVDPVMADGGKLYPGFSEDFPKQMLRLCERADVIVPNFTEAAFLLGEVYKEPPYDEAFVEAFLKRLSGITKGAAVLTGVDFGGDKLGAAILDKDGNIAYGFAEKLPGAFHGTGDVFGSALLAKILQGKSEEDSLTAAAEFTKRAISRTIRDKTDIRFGVNFEEGLSEFASL